MANAHSSAKEHTPQPGARRMHARHIALGLLYLCALALLATWEFRARFAGRSSDCKGPQDSVATPFYAKPYEALLNWATPDAAPQVVVMAIPQAVDEQQSSNCVGRGYLADVLRALAPLRPAEIVVDKFYSPESCVNEPATTEELRTSVRSIGLPVVIAESTQLIHQMKHGSCLVKKPQLDFQASNVSHGLARLNENREKLPVLWKVLPADQTSKDVRPKEMDSLAWAAVRRFDPSFLQQRRLQALIESDRHPYAKLNIDLPHTTTTELLCAYGSPAARERWNVDCGGPQTLPDMLGKVVVIGTERSEDMRTVLDRQMWGFDLHALYIEGLLSGAYLYTLPFAVSFLIFVLFIFVVEAVPTILVMARPQWKHKPFLCHAYKKRRYFWLLSWTAAILVGTTAAALALHYLPPLIVFGDVVLVVISRLVVMTAESAEHPLLHHQHQPTRKAQHA